ncbi:MAG: imelysin family protein [Paracoccaceae bacterium]
MMNALLTAMILAGLMAAPAVGDVRDAVQEHVLPATSGFAATTAVLAAAAQADCSATPLRPAYQAAFDSWMGISHLRLGPMEEEGRAIAISFWPDKKGMIPRALNRLIEAADPVATDPAEFAEVSIAARGFFALERLLYDPVLSDYGDGDYDCVLVQAVAGDLARMAADIDREWRTGFAQELEQAGGENSRYLDPREALQAIYTALDTGLEFNALQRIGRPMGSFAKPAPRRAEGWRSNRPLRNVNLSLMALRDLAHALTDVATPQTDAAFADALDVAARLDDPVFAGVADPSGRLKVEILQQRIAEIRHAIANEIGRPLGISAGFNAGDGD